MFYSYKMAAASTTDLGKYFLYGNIDSFFVLEATRIRVQSVLMYTQDVADLESLLPKDKIPELVFAFGSGIQYSEFDNPSAGGVTNNQDPSVNSVYDILEGTDKVIALYNSINVNNSIMMVQYRVLYDDVDYSFKFIHNKNDNSGSNTMFED